MIFQSSKFSISFSIVINSYSFSYPGPSRGLWRLKLVLGYCLISSLLVCLGVFLRLAVSLALHWNTEVPSPTSLSTVSKFRNTGRHEPAAVLRDLIWSGLPDRDGGNEPPPLVSPSRPLEVSWGWQGRRLVLAGKTNSSSSSSEDKSRVKSFSHSGAASNVQPCCQRRTTAPVGPLRSSKSCSQDLGKFELCYWSRAWSKQVLCISPSQCSLEITAYCTQQRRSYRT